MAVNIDIVFCDDKRSDPELKRVIEEEKTYNKKCHWFISVTGEYIKPQENTPETDDDFAELTPDELKSIEEHKALLKRLDDIGEKKKI
jgi:hypothetical protein